MPFICPKCSHSFNTNAKLENHLNKKNQCVSDMSSQNGIFCTFCNNSFSNRSNLKVHYNRCVVRKNPELLLKYIEKQDEILIQKDDIIDQQKKLLSQQAETIEHMKELKPETHIEGDNNNIDIDNSIHNIKNIDKSTNITHNNKITLIEQPFALRSADMLYLLDFHENNDESEFWVLANNIRDSMKRGDLDGMINSLLTYIHNNKKLREGRNLRYCPDGKYKGELLIYDYDEKGVGYWRPSDVRPVALVLSREFEHIRLIQDKKIIENADNIHARENNTEKENSNIGKLQVVSESLNENLAAQDAMVKFIKQFRTSKVVPDNIRGNILENDHPLDEKRSIAVKEHKKNDQIKNGRQTT